MSTTPTPALSAPATGDALLKRSRRALLATFLLLVPTILGAIYLMPTWRSIAGLSGIAFATSAALFGLAIAGLPLAIIVVLCIAAFSRVESLARPRRSRAGGARRVAEYRACTVARVEGIAGGRGRQHHDQTAD